MRTLILTSTIIAALAVTTGDADARKRNATRNRNVAVVSIPQPKPSPFDGETWQPPVTLPGLVSSYQAYAASQYTWEGKDSLFPTVVYQIKEELKMPQKPIIKRLSWVEQVSLGAVALSCLIMSGAVFWPIRNRSV